MYYWKSYMSTISNLSKYLWIILCKFSIISNCFSNHSMHSVNVHLDLSFNMVIVLVCIIYRCNHLIFFIQSHILLDDNECSRETPVCSTNSFCRNTPGSYIVREMLLITLLTKTFLLFIFSAIAHLVIKCQINNIFAKVRYSLYFCCLPVFLVY